MRALSSSQLHTDSLTLLIVYQSNTDLIHVQLALRYTVCILTGGTEDAAIQQQQQQQQQQAGDGNMLTQG
jgi:hypothetical protein